MSRNANLSKSLCCDRHPVFSLKTVFIFICLCAISVDAARPEKKTFVKRDAPEMSQYYIDHIFWRLDADDYLTMDNFTMLLKKIGLDAMTHDHGHDHDDKRDDHNNDDQEEEDKDDQNQGQDDQQRRRSTRAVADSEDPEKCMTSEALLKEFRYDGQTELTKDNLKLLCPALLDNMYGGKCEHDDHDNDHQHKKEKKERNMGLVWLYMMICVALISFCAVFTIMFIPKKSNSMYFYAIQFLIALGAGTLAGDGLLHLIPHAMMPEHDHDDHGHDDHHGHDEHDDHEDQHTDVLMKGLMAMIGVYAFFFLERIFAIYKAVKDREENPQDSEVKMIPRSDDDDMHNVISDGATNNVHHRLTERESRRRWRCPKMTPLALMIILGDLFHNFCDGLAIGAAFSATTTLGLSTSIAIFTHELPHEIGDFAVLIQSGLSKKEAVCLNFLSALSCFLGAIIGMFLGDIGSAPMWIFAGVGGMFLYISLTDLIPEMSKAYLEDIDKWYIYLSLHAGGLIFGAILMFLIGLYEHDLQNVLE